MASPLPRLKYWMLESASLTIPVSTVCARVVVANASSARPMATPISFGFRGLLGLSCASAMGDLWKESLRLHDARRLPCAFAGRQDGRRFRLRPVETHDE